MAWFWCFFGDDRYSEGEIHFNLMAIVPDRIVAWQKELERLQVQSAAAPTPQLHDEMQRLLQLVDDEKAKRQRQKVRRALRVFLALLSDLN